MPEYIPYMFFAFLLMLAAVQDIAYLKIPNAVILSLAVGFFPCAFAAQLPWSMIGVNVLVAAAAFVMGLILFGLKLIGGGDGKLIAACILWLGWNVSLVHFLMYTTLFGGVLALLIFHMRKVPAPAFLENQNWFLRLQQPNEGIPYGIAIALGGLLAVPNSPFYS